MIQGWVEAEAGYAVPRAECAVHGNSEYAGERITVRRQVDVGSGAA